MAAHFSIYITQVRKNSNRMPAEDWINRLMRLFYAIVVGLMSAGIQDRTNELMREYLEMKLREEKEDEE